MAETLETGRTHSLDRLVTAELTAEHFGNPGVAVFATPALVALLEETAIGCLEATLEEGQGSVGSVVEVEHLAPTPIGLTVRATATVQEVDGRRVVFAVDAHDGHDQIARGSHTRFVVGSLARFLERAEEKAP